METTRREALKMADSTDLHALTEEFYAARNTGDAAQAILDRFAPDGSFQILGPDRLGPFTQRFEGLDALRLAATELVRTWDLSGMVNVSIYTHGDTTLTHRKGKVRYLPTNREFETEFMDKMTFRNGKIVEYVQFIDTLGIAEAAGMINLDSPSL
jgi:ketosteroid isomerase-like protein